jgi:hypothetical protein
MNNKIIFLIVLIFLYFKNKKKTSSIIWDEEGEFNFPELKPMVSPINDLKPIDIELFERENDSHEIILNQINQAPVFVKTPDFVSSGKETKVYTSFQELGELIQSEREKTSINLQ